MTLQPLASPSRDAIRFRVALEEIRRLWTAPKPAQRQDVAYQAAVRIACEALDSTTPPGVVERARSLKVDVGSIEGPLLTVAVLPQGRKQEGSTVA